MKIDKAIENGITSTQINDLYTFPAQEINKTYKKLLEPLVQDPDLLDLLANEDNIQKIKHRLEFQITIKNQQNQPLATATHIGQKTLIDVIKDIQKLTMEKQTIEDYSKTIQKLLENRKWQFQYHMKGDIKTIQCTMIFRKHTKE